MIHIGDVVQFNEKHKWTGVLGIVEEINRERILVGVPAPEQGTAYIYCKKENIERVGEAIFIAK